MAEIYTLRAPAEYVSTECEIDKCPRYARFALLPHDVVTARRLACGQHLAVVIKGMMYAHRTGIVVQEVPGNWLRGDGEMIAENGEIVRVSLPAGMRKGTA